MEYIYTPQQIAGYKGYGHKVRIGNWSEEMELEENRLKDFLTKKSTGNLSLTRAEERFGKALRPVSLTPSSDGKIRFGDVLMIYSHGTEGTVACDVKDRVKSEAVGFACTTSWYNDPCSRNTFVVQRYNPPRMDSSGLLFDDADDVVKYGQKFQLVNVEAGDSVLFLQSKPKSNLVHSKYSREQEVAVSDAEGYNTVWKAGFMDPKFRFEMEGQDVGYMDPLVLTHCATNQWMSSDSEVTYNNDFGVEYEVCCSTHLDVSRKNFGVREAALAKLENQFSFVCGPPEDGAASPGGDGAPSPGGDEAPPGESREMRIL